MKKVKLLILGILFYVFALLAILFALLAILFLGALGGSLLLVGFLPLMLLGLILPMAYLLYFIEERSWLVVNSLLFLVMSVCLLVLPMLPKGDTIDESSFNADAFYLAFYLGTLILLQICWMAVILFSPVRQLTRRLGFVVLGVLTLVAFSEISKLNLHQYLQPPKVSDNSVR